MIKRIENWLRLIFNAEVVTLEARLNSEIQRGLAVIGTTLTKRVDELSARTATNVAEAVVRLQQNVDSEVQKMKNTVDQELNHCRASKAQHDADELLRHPRYKR
jgi:hypothetical protein